MKVRIDFSGEPGSGKTTLRDLITYYLTEYEDDIPVEFPQGEENTMIVDMTEYLKKEPTI